MLFPNRWRRRLSFVCFFKKWVILGLFFISNKHYEFYNKLMWKVNPVSGAGIRSLDLLNISHEHRRTCKWIHPHSYTWAGDVYSHTNFNLFTHYFGNIRWDSNPWPCSYEPVNLTTVPDNASFVLGVIPIRIISRLPPLRFIYFTLIFSVTRIAKLWQLSIVFIWYLAKYLTYFGKLLCF